MSNTKKGSTVDSTTDQQMYNNRKGIREAFKEVFFDKKGDVLVLVHSAKNLQLKSKFGRTEPFVKVSIGTKSMYAMNEESPVPVEKIDNPKWRKKLIFKNISPHHFHLPFRKSPSPEQLNMIIKVYDRDSDKIDHKLGEFQIPLKSLKRGSLQIKWYELETGGSIKIGVQPLNFGEIVWPEDKDTNLEEIISKNHDDTANGGERIAPPCIKQIKDSETLKTKLDIPRIKKKGASVLKQYESKNLKRSSPALAAGSFGTVYKGKVDDIKEVVIIKDILMTNLNAVQEWKKEIEMLGYNKKNKYVVRIYGYCFSEKKLSIVMEFMSKGSLYELLYERNEMDHFSIIQRLRMCRHCVRALCYVHACGIMHRDIKSPNILVSSDFSCKLGDFGCAKFLASSVMEKPPTLQRKHTANVGSPLWMCAEMKTSEYDFPIDVYSMGLVLYEILEGTLPGWNKTNKIAVLPDIFLGCEIIEPCLNQDPKKRPTAYDLLAALDGWLNNILQELYSSMGTEFDSMVNQSTAPLDLKSSPPSEPEYELKVGDDLARLYNFMLVADNRTSNRLLRQLGDLSPTKLEQRRLGRVNSESI